MTWLLWRQYRASAYWTAALFSAFAVAIALTGVSMAHTYDRVTNACSAGKPCVVGHLFNGDGAIIDIVHFSILLPVLLGVFVGATLVARETEHATNGLVWTQSVTRRHWVYSKVATAMAATLVVSAAVSVLVTWWSGTPNSLAGNRFEGAQFDTQNVLPVAAALFAVALGLAMGAFFRRTLPAIASTVAGYVAVRLVIALYLRPHFLAPLHTSVSAAQQASVPPGSWTISNDIVGSSGHVVTGPIQIPAGCQAIDRQGAQACLARAGYHNTIAYHPPSHYWPIQLMESGVLLALAAVLVTVAIVRTLRRDA